jgi:cobalt-precorrin-5B (C1)-methyltransferase
LRGRVTGAAHPEDPGARRPAGPLRRGWTTGTCAAAAARCAFQALLTGSFPATVSVRLPKGERPVFVPVQTALTPLRARAGIVKDAGDDPDITHGATIIAEVAFAPTGAGIRFQAGPGVGTVTRPGLPLSPGEPAINPGPRRIITLALEDCAQELDAPPHPDLDVTISIPGGAELAAKTLNSRLGIIGGLSILGTTGVVIPYSCASWIHSIHRGIDVARAAGLTHIAAATGSTSEAAVRALYGLPEEALLDMGDFVGGTLKYLRRHPVARLTLAGGFAKMAKLAQGHLDLHSGASRVELAGLAQILADLGADEEVAAAAKNAAGAGEVLAIAASLGTEFAAALTRRIAQRARDVALAQLAGQTALDVAIFDRQGRLAARAE